MSQQELNLHEEHGNEPLSARPRKDAPMRKLMVLVDSSPGAKKAFDHVVSELVDVAAKNDVVHLCHFYPMQTHPVDEDSRSSPRSSSSFAPSALQSRIPGDLGVRVRGDSPKTRPPSGAARGDRGFIRGVHRNWRHAEPHALEAVRTEEEYMKKRGIELLRDFGAVCQKNGIPWKAHILSGDDVRDTVVDYASKLEPHILTVGSRGHGTLKRVLLGSLSSYCVHHCTCPVLVVR